MRRRRAVVINAPVRYDPRMPRTAIETLLRRMDAAYRSDPFHGFRKNVGSVRPEEWNVRPGNYSVDEFGPQDSADLSICDLVLHVAGAKHMYVDRIFGDAVLEWSDIRPPSTEIEAALAWLDDGFRLLYDGLAALPDDAELAVERPAPWRLPMTREQLLGIMINHDVYHSGEINRQRALIRGANGWDH